jgi:prephenate dehydrogenase
VSIEHSPGQPVGLVELSVAPGAQHALAQALIERGWQLHS